MKYIVNPQDIEKESMAIIERRLPGLLEIPSDKRSIIKRIIHTTGDVNIAPQIKIHPMAISAGLKSLSTSCSIISDVNMVLAGLNKKKLSKLNIQTYCRISDPDIAELSVKTGQTRAMVAMKKAGAMTGDIVVIGNAPTALFTLCELITQGHAHPALVIGTPVGFVGASESKDLLVGINKVPYITVLGTRGGSNIAASIINALLKLID